MEETEDSSLELGGEEVVLGENQGGTSTPVKKTLEAAVGGKPVANTKKPQGTAPTKPPTEKEKAEEETVADKAGEKIQDKVVDAVKEKVQDKAKEVLGDPKKGKEELADTVIDAVNKANANRATRLAVGQHAAQVSTTVSANANVSPVNVSQPNAAAAANAVPTPPPTSQAAAAASNASAASQRVANGAGRGTPPASAMPAPKTASKGAGMIDELMTYGKELSSAVFKGAKESKNIRMLGLTALAGATGWAVGKQKDAQKAQTQEFNRQQAIRNSLMSDG